MFYVYISSICCFFKWSLCNLFLGTDATHADHIETIKNRLYVGLENQIHFVPGELGIGLVEGYDSMGFAMSKPHLRAELEADLKG